MAQAEEDEPDVVCAVRASSATASMTVSGSNQFQIPPRPEQHAIVLADPGHDALEHAARVRCGGSGSMPNGTTSIRSRNDGSRGVALVVDASGLQQRAEPEVALRLARADERVAGSQRRPSCEPVELERLRRLPLGALRASSARFSMCSGAYRS